MTAGQNGEWISIERDGDALALRLSGRWTVRDASAIDNAIMAVPLDGARRVSADLSAIEVIDSAGALVLYRGMDRFRAAGAEAANEKVPEAFAPLIARVEQAERKEHPPPPKLHPFLASFERIGRHTVEAAAEARDLLSFLGATLIAAGRVFVRPGRLRLVSMLSHMERAGFAALPIVGLLAFLIGIVLAYQSADQLERFGAQIFTVNLLGVSILREIGIVLTSVVVAGRSGSAFTAQIGTMKVREEIDAMRTLGLDPVEVLVLPRIFALVLVLPLLAFYADVMGLLGGAIMSVLVLDISPFLFLQQLKSAVTPWTYWIGIIKAPVFAFLIALVGCFQGLRVSGSAESVGRLTTQSVVQGIFLVIVADAFFSILFSTLGI